MEIGTKEPAAMDTHSLWHMFFPMAIGELKKWLSFWRDDRSSHSDLIAGDGASARYMTTGRLFHDLGSGEGRLDRQQSEPLHVDMSGFQMKGIANRPAQQLIAAANASHRSTCGQDVMGKPIQTSFTHEAHCPNRMFRPWK